MRPLIALSGLASTSLAAQLTLHFAPHTPLLPSPSTQLPPSTHATALSQDGTLNSARLDRADNIFFAGLTPGSHLLSIFTTDLVYPQYRIDVAKRRAGEPDESIEVVQTFRGNSWDNKGPIFGAGNDTVTVNVVPVARKEYYAKREGFSLASIFRNPMMLMALVSAVMVFGMPYLMENMDEEQKAEFAKAQESNPLAGGGAAALQNFDFASWMAGGKTPEAPAAIEESKKSSKKGGAGAGSATSLR